MNRGEIWAVRLDPVVGSEQGKTRPCVVVSGNRYHRSSIRLVVPLTSWQARFVSHPNKRFVAATEANQLQRDSAADVMQLRTVSTDRFLQSLGRLEDAELTDLCELIATIVEA